MSDPSDRTDTSEADGERDDTLETHEEPNRATRTDGGPEVAGANGAEASPSEPMPTFDFRTTVIARTIVRVVMPLVLVTALALLFQGHNRPGGGFIGATLTTTAFALVYVVFGLEFLQNRLLGMQPAASEAGGHAPTGGYRALFGLGLAIAAGSGLVPVVAGLLPGFETYPFLTQGVLFLEHLPIYEELEVASALAFDVGVFLAVIGAVLTIVAEVGTE